MKLRRALVQNFRSVCDSGEFDVEPHVTVVIGKNEQGKTNLLKALQSFNSSYAYVVPADLPNHLVPSLADRDPATVQMVSLWLSIEPDDISALAGVVEGIEQLDQLKATKFLDGHYEYVAIGKGAFAQLKFALPDITEPIDQIRVELYTLRERINAHGARQPGFQPSVDRASQLITDFGEGKFSDLATLDNLVETFLAGLKALPGQDAAIQNEFEALQKRLTAIKAKIADALRQDPKVRLTSQLPIFVLHEAGADRIPDNVSIASFIANPVQTSRGMANLCKAAGLSIQKLQELANSQDDIKRSSYEDHYKSKISGAINEFWTQADYTLYFLFRDLALTVYIADNIYSNRISPSARSDGFQWYLSFYSALTADAATAGKRILLLDNPGLELHADGQRDVKRFIEEKQSQHTQVIYVTHSPAMVDAFQLNQIRKVERLGDNVGTKVGRLSLEGGLGSDLLEPLRSAIGASLVNSLMVNDANILVEGAADKPILEGAIGLVDRESNFPVSINGSIAETGSFLPRFYQRASLPYVVYVDHDDGGRRLTGQLERDGIPRERIVSLASTMNLGRDMELEDVLTESMYHQAVQDAYPDKVVPLPPASNEKRTKRYTELFRTEFKIGFGKTRVADKVKDLLSQGKADEESRDALLKVAKSLLDPLERQVAAPR